MYEYNVNILRVIDGDTVEATIDLGFHITYRAHIRLAGMNAPEMFTPEGPKSKEHLLQLCGVGKGVLYSKGFDKYGRVLGTITVNGVVLNKQMIDDGFAIAA